MATAVRESYFPAIKCSMCNADVEITQLGDHICAGAGSVQEAPKSPKPSLFPLFKGKSTKITQAQKLASLPKIDPVTASMVPANGDRFYRKLEVLTSVDQTYQGRDTLTPSSSTTGSARSPPTPKDGQPLRTPIHGSPSLSPNPQRSYTARKGSSASSSIYNIDSPFPPFKSSISPMSPHALPKISADKEFYPSQVPASPIAINNKSVSSRINNIAPGPFGVNHSNTSRDRVHDVLPVAASSFPERGSSKAARANMEAFPMYPEMEGERMIRRDQIERGEYSASRRERRDRGREQDVPRRMPTSGSDHSSRASSKARRSQSPGSRQPPKERNAPPIPIPSLGFGKWGGKISDEQDAPSSNPSRYSDTGPSNPKVEVLRPETRANTFPEAGHKRTPSSGRVPPHPGIGLPRSPAVTVGGHKKNNSSSNLSKVPPTGPLPKIPDEPAGKRESRPRRQPSLGSNKLGADVPRSTLTDEAVSLPSSRRLSPPNPHEYSDFSIANPYELDTPAESSNVPSPSISSNASSIFSHRSERSSASATSSPPTPDVNNALRSSGSRHEKERRAPENTSRIGGGGFNDIDGLMKELQISMHDLAPTPVQERFEERFEERSLPVPREKVRVSSRDRQGPPPQPAPLKRQPPPPGVYQEPPARPSREPSQTRPLNIQRNRTPPPPVPRPVDELFMDVQSKPQQQERSRRPAVSKGPCRGCGEEIFGKSISSADGRLTGRYHKACFVCQDCRKPFESAEFYVHDNLPYCERHYHQRNQSLCPTCDTGIEGPCLETEWHERYHPTCFSCSECACSLGGDYFELNGRPYCEQHAYQIQKGNNSLGINHMAKMERRKTRLTFM
ncbi:hypothetical protein P167DRAFT_545730 [Morchella conica CCBAS932]|uniref:LIM zinc-binding domain-containing protein n=1 Tax=Morchella conica CCBAS932 TaxID=1392247 RepID=A0A3N4KNM1_9PEZI|nr:hypothetical protein P167DRAFT_545730 [Morchella conica CCBAS932]